MWVELDNIILNERSLRISTLWSHLQVETQNNYTHRNKSGMVVARDKG